MFRVSYLWSFPLCCRSKGISPSIFAFLGYYLPFSLSVYLPLSVPSSIFLIFILSSFSFIFLLIYPLVSFPLHSFPIFHTFLSSPYTSTFSLNVLPLFLCAVNLTYSRLNSLFLPIICPSPSLSIIPPSIPSLPLSLSSPYLLCLFVVIAYC